MTTLSASARAWNRTRRRRQQVSLTGVQPCGFRLLGGEHNATT